MRQSSSLLSDTMMQTAPIETRTVERKVCFNRTACKTHLIESRHDLNKDEVECIWYSAEEYSRFRSKNRVMQRMMKNGLLVKEDDIDFCFRGIIHDQLRQRRMAHRQQALESLCCEQQRQYMSGIIDEEKIRSVLLLCTKAATEEAIARAEEDRLAALNSVFDEPTRKVASSQELSTLASALAYKVNFNAFAQSAQQRRALFVPVANDKSDLVALLDDALCILDKR